MFENIKSKVQDRLNQFLASDGDLFVVDLEKNALFEAYLAALPEHLRQEHNCHCCRHFLNNYGNIVAIENSVVKTLWEFEVVEPYDAVPDALHALVKAAPIKSIFVTSEHHLGTDSNVQRLPTGEVIRWTHFYAKNVASRIHRDRHSIDAVVGSANTNRQVFERALKELTVEASETVLELISQNSLYRGAEFKSVVSSFLKQQKEVAGLSEEALTLYTLANLRRATSIRNSAIGTLLVDLSEGRELDSAVAAFEQKVAPTNYRRPTAIVTKGMLEKAEKDLAELGLLDSLARRHAQVDDIPVDVVQFVDRSAGDSKGGGLFDTLKDDLPVDPKTFSRVEEVTIDRFLSEVIPTATGIEVLVENKHIGNLVNLTAPVNPDASPLFNWSNGIAWAYKDGNADSVKEKVKAAGGRVDGELRISLSWYNYDDLDLHVIEPDGNEIAFHRKSSSNGNGRLDVDMNAGGGTTREPVENVIFVDETKMLEGTYRVSVNNFNRRESLDTGFNVEIECKGEVLDFQVDKSPTTSKTLRAAEFKYSKEKGVYDVMGIGDNSSSGSKAVSKDVFGISTNKFQKVSMILPSPNHWDSEAKKGNLHTLFILDKARTDAEVRGIFNEFLKPELNAHRKVFELLGNKSKIAPAENQLAGLGFSSTQNAEVICRVTGRMTRLIKIKF